MWAQSRQICGYGSRSRGGEWPMVEVATRRGRRKARERLAAATAYAEMGWPVCAGAYPLDGAAQLRGGQQPHGAGRACSCDRVGCPDPGAHPVSPAWQNQATVDTAVITKSWPDLPGAYALLLPRPGFHPPHPPAAPRPIAP